MPGPNPEQCKPGDVILFYGFNLVSTGETLAMGLKFATILPAVASAVQIGGATLGRPDCNHAAIITRVTPHFELAHATASGIRTDYVEDCFRRGRGASKLFRCRYGTAGAEAAQVARRWAPHTMEVSAERMSFAKGKAFLSALRSSYYGPGAKARAARCRQHRDTEGGPHDLNANIADTSMFCSMFVISCYQAVLGDDAVTGQVMGLDCASTSPMTLHGYLRSNKLWEEVNAIPAPG